MQIKRFGEKNREENKQLRAWMKRHTFAERRLKAIAEDIQDQIDCTVCANCCRVATTPVTRPRMTVARVPIRICETSRLNSERSPMQKHGCVR